MKVIEIVGHDGSGKTTLAEVVKRKLVDRGYIANVLKINPFNTEIYQANKESLQILMQIDKELYNEKFEKLVAQVTCKTISSCLKNSTFDYLICDRYIETMGAYLRTNKIGGKLYYQTLKEMPMADFIVYLDVSVETIKRRLKLRGDEFCGFEYKGNQYIMDELRRHPNCRTVNGEAEVEEVAEKIMLVIMEA